MFWNCAVEPCCLLSCQDALLVVEPDNMAVHLSWFHGLYSYLLTFLFVTEYYISIRVPLGNLFLYYSLIWITSVFWKCTSVDSLKDWCQSFHLTDWVSGFTYLYWLRSVASFNWCQLLHFNWLGSVASLNVQLHYFTDMGQLLQFVISCFNYWLMSVVLLNWLRSVPSLTDWCQLLLLTDWDQLVQLVVSCFTYWLMSVASLN